MLVLHRLFDAVGAQARNLPTHVKTRLVAGITERVTGIATNNHAAGLRHETGHVTDGAADDDIDALHRDTAARRGITFDDDHAAVAGGRAILGSATLDLPISLTSVRCALREELAPRSTSAASAGSRRAKSPILPIGVSWSLSSFSNSAPTCGRTGNERKAHGRRLRLPLMATLLDKSVVPAGLSDSSCLSVPGTESVSESNTRPLAAAGK